MGLITPGSILSTTVGSLNREPGQSNAPISTHGPFEASADVAWKTGEIALLLDSGD